MTIRDLVSLGDCHAVVAIERDVWGAGAEIVPASVLLVSAKRGGILVGVFDEEDERLMAFVWSMPGRRDGQPTHWSHMLAVRPEARGHGLGARLKIAQRERALAQGVDLIEWTFDPLQAQNAYLNCAQLGAVASTYLVDAYGPMAGTLHAGLPTDRLVAEWHLRTPHVERRLAALARSRPLTARGADVLSAPVALAARPSGEWTEPIVAAVESAATRVLVAVPSRFTDMSHRAAPMAMAWRLAAREVLTGCFARGARVVDFRRDDESGGGQYVLASG